MPEVPPTTHCKPHQTPLHPHYTNKSLDQTLSTSFSDFYSSVCVYSIHYSIHLSDFQCCTKRFPVSHIAFTYFTETPAVSGEQSKAPMSFFGFDPRIPQDHGHPAQAPGFGSAPDPFASISQSQGLGQEDDDAYVDCLPLGSMA